MNSGFHWLEELLFDRLGVLILRAGQAAILLCYLFSVCFFFKRVGIAFNDVFFAFNLYELNNYRSIFYLSYLIHSSM